MGPYRNTTAAIQAENVKLIRHNLRGNIFKNINTSYTTQYPNSYFHYESNCNKPHINNNAIIATSYILTYTSPTLQPVIQNYADLQQFGLNCTIHAAKKAGFIDKLEEHYTKCRLITIFQ